MLLGVLLITFIVLGNDATPPRLAPCPSLDWQDVTSFLVALSLAIAFVESLNWLRWLITRDRVLPAESDQPSGDLLIPSGWAGPGLTLGLIAMAYVLRRPNLCEPLHFATMSLRDFVGTLSLAFGLLILAQAYHGLKPKGSPPKPE
jgi:hypothetical protein